MRISLKIKNKEINLNVKKCNLFWALKGLMFTRREKARALLLCSFKKPKKMRIHSLFVFFPFVAVWLDNKNRIIDFKVVKPFSFSVCSERVFYKLVEIPFNKKHKRIFKILVGDAKDLNSSLI